MQRGTLALLVFFALVLLMTVGGFAFVTWRPPAASTEGRGIDGVIGYVLVATGGILIAGHVVLGYFLWRSANGGGDAYRRPSARFQWAWALGPVVVMSAIAEAGVLFLGAPVWHDLYVAQPEDPLRIEVVGQQFEWFVRYPGDDGVFGRTDFTLVDRENFLGLDEDDPAAADDVVSRGVLRLPVGRSAVIRLRTHDLLHSFFVPQFRVKQDLVPGLATRAKITPTTPGEYELACAELCGLGHYRMRGKVIVMEKAEFEKWLDSQIGWFE